VSVARMGVEVGDCVEDCDEVAETGDEGSDILREDRLGDINAGSARCLSSRRCVIMCWGWYLESKSCLT
jgi:hypothetical protein